MVDIPANVLELLVCNKCEQLLRKGPVFQQHDGVAICGLCHEREDAQPASRCLLYETTAQLLRFPCRYQDEGCPETVPFVAADSTQFGHEDGCEYRQYVCPVLGSTRCDWAGNRSQLLRHCQQKHPDRVLPNPAVLTPDIRRSQMTNYVISAFHFLFLIHTRICLTTAKLYYAVRLLGHPGKATNYTYTISIERGENTITRTQDVLPQELLVLQEHSALNLQTNSLLSLLGGWDGASLSVKVKQRKQTEPEQEQVSQRRQADQEQEKCGRCKARTPRLYRDGQKWLCTRCAPQKETCDNEGCDFQDFQFKRNKHSVWFCLRRTKCLLCNAILQPNRLWQHFITCNRIKAKVIPTGSRFLIRHNNNTYQYFLVETTAGLVMCECYYTKNEFSLYVSVPMPSEQLHLYRCEMCLECAGVTRTHTPDVEYNTAWEWKILSKKDRFFSNRDVHVSVVISRTQ